VSVRSEIVFAGVGGQGVLSIASLIAAAAMSQRLHVKQGEVHGMAQRGGAVQASLRISDAPIFSDLVPRGTADAILALEPVESLRYLTWLAPTGTVVTALDPFLNIPNYPPIEDIVARLRSLPRVVLVEAERLAKEAGTVKASNVVVLGAAAHLLPLPPELLEQTIRMMFGRKGDKVVEANLRAFALGQEAARCARR
jgi:indolepyruvate ferredoxin oxidoreductase beta subunit